MKELHEKETKISIVTETKLKLNPNLQLVAVKKKTGKYVDELWLKFLLQAEVIEGYKFHRDGNETIVELIFEVEENQ